MSRREQKSFIASLVEPQKAQKAQNLFVNYVPFVANSFPEMVSFVGRFARVSISPIILSCSFLLVSCSRQDTGPRQPIAFSHETHAGQFQINCQYCHSGAKRGPNAYVPSMQTCMGCHQLVAATKPEIVKVRQLWESKRPVVWTRMNRLADFVFFNHQPHISKGVECATCHGDLTKMPEVKPPFTVNNMSWCVDCHRENKASIDCYTCHR